MNYSSILNRAWQIAWQHRFLWIFGLFAGIGQAGNGFQYDFGSGENTPTMFTPALDEGLFYPEVLLLIFAGVLLAVVVLIVLSAVAKGALIGSVQRLDRGETANFKTGVSDGFKNFLSILGIGLVIGLAVTIFVLILAALFIIPIVVSFSNDSVVAGFILVGLAVLTLLLVVIPLLLATGVVSTYAEAARVVERKGVFSSISRGVSLLRARLGNSAILFLINLGLSMGFGLVLVLAGLITIGPAMLLVKQSIIAAVLLALPGAAVLILASAVFQTFVSSYWTLAFMEMTDHDEEGENHDDDYAI
ncbi:MAG: DUF7544 domain-containing protein [Candidatus Aquicultorales bacterium]